MRTVPNRLQDKKRKLTFFFTEKSFIIDHPDLPVVEADEKLKEEFSEDRFAALFHLGFQSRRPEESPSLGFLHSVASDFMEALTDTPDLEVSREETKVSVTEDMADRILNRVPFGIGTEFISQSWVANIFRHLSSEFKKELSVYPGTVKMFLAEKSQNLRVPERVFFHLVENREDPDYPFAFLATYATKGENGGVRHMPLSFALTEYREDRTKLLDLLSCLNRASEVSPLIASFVESGEMFHPLRLSGGEAWEFLKCVPDIEKSGIVCRVPNWWRKKTQSISLQVTLGKKKPSLLGFEGIVEAVPELSVDGVPLTKAEIRELLARSDGLAFLKGRWVEVDHARLEQLLKKMDQYGCEMTLLDALRMENGLREEEDPDNGVLVTNGQWLSGFLAKMRKPSSIRQARIPAGVHADLRPYQRTGFTWIKYMSELGFGACLADDMGLGKTLQVLTFLEMLRKKNPDARTLLIVPASLMENWKKEAEKFTPLISISILHGMSHEAIREVLKTNASFLTITTYAMVSRIPELSERTWDCLILDEAQAIKNPGTKQTRTIKQLKGNFRLALTGTPVENDLTNLWSLFDFLDKGLLGSSKEFSDFTKNIETDADGYQKLRQMVSPFILRRLKTDKKIIADLPEKLEQVEYVDLSREQVVLYRKQVADLIQKIESSAGIQRKGLVLSAITKLKQICNHPDQYLGQTEYAPGESGKFKRLGEICDAIYQRRERVLVFTQYKEITPYLRRYLKQIFGMDGFVIHGGVPVKKRQEMVDIFNGENYVPFMVLSVKAAGTGLNLTAANHVIHFDRWWNPAVENQATDRAYRIGQKKNVVVHKFVSVGTIEEKIDSLINSKKELAENVIGSGESWITELSNDELFNLFKLE